MTYKEYSQTHEEERREADGCDLCKYEDRQPWEEPCKKCKRNCMDLYERNIEKYGKKEAYAYGGRVYKCYECFYANKCDRHICFQAMKERRADE